jgi:hypothetical protein
VLDSDPHASSAVVRDFLGLPKLHDCFGDSDGSDCGSSTFDDEVSSQASVTSFLADRALFTIAEGENESPSSFA